MTKAVETFLGGRVSARQPDAGYRAAVDTVLLGAAITIARGGRALELGCGAGTALLIAAARNPDAMLVGVERNPDMLALAQENILRNGLEARVAVMAEDAAALPCGYVGAFDAVFFNPPYYDARAVRPPLDPVRRDAFVSEHCCVEGWITAGLRALNHRGRLTLVHRAERLDDVLACLRGVAGEARVKPVQPRAGAAAKRVVVRARKGARSPLSLLPPLCLHQADGSWTPEAVAIHAGEAGLELDG